MKLVFIHKNSIIIGVLNSILLKSQLQLSAHVLIAKQIVFGGKVSLLREPNIAVFSIQTVPLKRLSEGLHCRPKPKNLADKSDLFVYEYF